MFSGFSFDKLKKNFFKTDEQLEGRFLQAVEINNVEEIVRCLNAGINPNTATDDGTTALHMSSERGELALTLKLVSFNNINLQPYNDHGLTPIHLACIYGKAKIVKLLVKNGADPNIRDRFGKTPLHMVARNQNVAMAMHLIKSGADVNVVDVMERTPLLVSLIEVPFLPMATYLLKHGADPNLITEHMMPLFHECVLHCHNSEGLEVVSLLVECGADCNIIDPTTKRNALHLAASNGYFALVILLLKWACDTEHRDISGRKPIDVAYQHDNEDAIYILENYEDMADLFITDSLSILASMSEIE